MQPRDGFPGGGSRSDENGDMEVVDEDEDEDEDDLDDGGHDTVFDYTLYDENRRNGGN